MISDAVRIEMTMERYVGDATKSSGYKQRGPALMVGGAVMGLSFMTWHKEHMTGTEVLKVQTSCEPFGSHIGTDGNPHASQVATG